MLHETIDDTIMTGDFYGSFLFSGIDYFQDKEYPGDAVQDQIEPVDGTGETALGKHDDFFNDMRRLEGREAECEAENKNNTPG